MEAGSQPAGRSRAYWAVYSLAERERRWRAVRERAAQAGFDCIFVPLGNGCDGRYLTQFKAASIVLPTDGRPPVVMVEPLTERGAFNDWVPEPRPVRRGQWPDVMAGALMDLGMERARIGVVGLKRGTVTHVHAPDGTVNHSSYVEVAQRLPNAVLEDATDVVGICRYVKSEEETHYLRRSASIGEAGLEVLMEGARPGVDLAGLYAEAMARMLELGSEYSPLALSLTSEGTRSFARYTNPPLNVRLENGVLIVFEVHAVAGAQVAQHVRSTVVGGLSYKWERLLELQRDVFDYGLGFMKPGTRIGQFIDAVTDYGRTPGMETSIAIQGCGYGDDGPLVRHRGDGEQVRDVRIEAGTALVWKPCAMTTGQDVRFEGGGPVLITATGPDVLMKRGHGGN